MSFWNDIFASAGAQSLEILNCKSFRREFHKGQHLYDQGQKPELIFFIDSGIVALVGNCSQGSEILLRLFGPTQILGHRSVLAQEDYHASAIALEPVKARCLSAAVFQSLLKSDDEIASTVFRYLARELRQQEERLCALSDKPVAARIAEGLIYLLRFQNIHNFTRRQIAEYCGTTEPTVIRTLAKFVQENLIITKGKKIEIKDYDGLLEIALQGKF